MQYMPAKPNKWGLKAWGLADAKTGYMCNWKLYLGKEAGVTRELPVAHSVVLGLTEPYHNKGHVIYMDNFFSSPALYKDLADHQMGACGTLRINRKGVPPIVQNAKPKAGDPPVTTRDGPILYIVWFDKRLVSLITTAHNSSTFKKKVKSKKHTGMHREVDKPVAIQSYSQHMGGIDRADKAMTFYLVVHRCCKWWKKVFFYLLEVCFCNALVIWRHSHRRVDAEQFRLTIVHGLLDGYQRDTSLGHGRPSRDPPNRLIGGEHFIILNPNQAKNGRRSQPDCAVCSDRKVKRHQTQYICKKCEQPLCVYPCFERYHTLVNYKITCTKELHQ